MNTKPNRSAAAWIWDFAGKYRPKYILSVLTAVCGVICGILPYFVMAEVISDLLGGCRESGVYLKNCLIMAALWVGCCGFHSISTTLSHKATFAVLGNIRKRVCEKLFRVPLGTMLDMPSGSVKNVLVERIDSIETTMAHIISEFTSNLLVPVALLVYLFILDWRMALAVLDMPTMDIDGKDIAPASYDIDVENVEFSYEKRKIINGISVHIPQKTTTAIVGPSGGDKTTLCHLIACFWDVDRGSVKLGGMDVKEYSMDSLMRNFSFVFQNVYLFRDTIANNIRFGQPDASMEKVIEAAKKACCHDFIMALPDGYETVIGEGGESLSGGEKQRISIARAIMKDAPIIILDEATANVDPESEQELTSAIEALTKEKTILMIAHRLKTVRHADNILVIDGGKIVQSGTHEQLMQRGGIYRRFVEARELAVGWKV